MSADLLRRAAAKIRETAQAADTQMQVLGWTWAPDIDGALGGESGTHAALWSPDVALMIADWLDGSASDLEYGGSLAACDAPGVVQYHVDFARLILGESS